MHGQSVKILFYSAVQNIQRINRNNVKMNQWTTQSLVDNSILWRFHTDIPIPCDIDTIWPSSSSYGREVKDGGVGQGMTEWSKEVVGMKVGTLHIRQWNIERDPVRRKWTIVF